MATIIDVGHFIFFNGNWCFHGEWRAQFDFKKFEMFIPYTGETVSIKRYVKNSKGRYYYKCSHTLGDHLSTDGEIELHNFNPDTEDWIYPPIVNKNI